MKEQNPTHSLTVNVPVDGEGTHVGVVYGCRYPDGTIEWEHFTDSGSVRCNYELLVQGHPAVTERWQKTLSRRAEAANIQVSEYIESHTLLKRTVILATTAPEEV